MSTCPASTRPPATTQIDVRVVELEAGGAEAGARLGDLPAQARRPRARPAAMWSGSMCILRRRKASSRRSAARSPSVSGPALTGGQGGRGLLQIAQRQQGGAEQAGDASRGQQEVGIRGERAEPAPQNPHGGRGVDAVGRRAAQELAAGQEPPRQRQEVRGLGVRRGGRGEELPEFGIVAWLVGQALRDLGGLVELPAAHVKRRGGHGQIGQRFAVDEQIAQEAARAFARADGPSQDADHAVLPGEEQLAQAIEHPRGRPDRRDVLEDVGRRGQPARAQGPGRELRPRIEPGEELVEARWPLGIGAIDGQEHEERHGDRQLVAAGRMHRHQQLRGGEQERAVAWGQGGTTRRPTTRPEERPRGRHERNPPDGRNRLRCRAGKGSCALVPRPAARWAPAGTRAAWRADGLARGRFPAAPGRATWRRSSPLRRRWDRWHRPGWPEPGRRG